jgi:hypothetical protein
LPWRRVDGRDKPGHDDDRLYNYKFSSTAQPTKRVLVLGSARRSPLDLVVEGGGDHVRVLFRVLKSRAADRESDNFMTLPRSRQG